MHCFPFLPHVIALMVSAIMTGAASADTAVQIVVTNIMKDRGVLLAGAYSSPETWLGATAVAAKEIPVAGNVRDGTLTFDMSLPPGRYGLSVLQDMNGNRQLDTNFMGIPTEPSGSSNDAPARWGPPKFKDAVFTVGDAPVGLTIKLN